MCILPSSSDWEKRACTVDSNESVEARESVRVSRGMYVLSSGAATLTEDVRGKMGCVPRTKKVHATHMSTNRPRVLGACSITP